MKKMLLLALLQCCLWGSVSAAEVKDIAYYDKDFPVTGDIKYLRERCKLDLRTPDGVKNFPTVVWFHGGGLARGNKFYPQPLDYERVAVAAVNYRLSGKGASCPDYIYDAAAAAAWVKKHIKEFGGDPNMVFVAGHSAGGYLTAMIALADKYLAAYGVKPKDFAGFFPFSGQMTTHFQVMKERKDKGEKVPDILIDEFSPIGNASANAPEITLLMGDRNWDWPARLEENLLLEARLRRVYKVTTVRCIEIPSTAHGSMRAPGCTLMYNFILYAVKMRDKKAKKANTK